jgi:hypothetical protein
MGSWKKQLSKNKKNIHQKTWKKEYVEQQRTVPNAEHATDTNQQIKKGRPNG